MTFPASLPGATSPSPVPPADARDALAMAFAHSRDLMLLCRVEAAGCFRVLAVNQSYVERVKMIGVEVAVAELVGLDFDGLVARLGLSPEMARAIRDRLLSVVASGVPLEYDETTPVRGGVFQGRTTLTPIPDAAGACAHVLYSSRDVSAQRGVEDALARNRSLFSNLLGNLSGMAYRCRNDAWWTMEFVSEGIRELAGYAPENVILNRDICWEHVMHPEDRARVRAEFEAKAAPGLRWSTTYRILTSGGEVRWVFEQALAIGDRTGERIEYYEGIITDITVIREAQEALRDSEEKFAKAFRSSPYSLTISDRETGRYLDINVGFERLSGYARDEVVGRTSLELDLWVDPQDREELVRRLAAEGSVRAMEIRFRTKGGGIVVTLCNVEAIDLGGLPCLLSAVEDITTRRRVEEEKARLEAQLRQNQKLESLGTLAGGIAHDFNNILTVIIVNQELTAMDRTLSADTRDRIEAIARASNRAKNLVRQILTFSRQEPVARRRQQLAPLVAEALGFVRASLPATIEIDQTFAPETPTVRVDENQVHQVVMNLCTNAAQAMRSGRGRLTLRLDLALLDADAIRDLPGLVPGRHARLLVADTGHGMDEAVMTRIFEPFFTTKGPGEGTGLGLSLVHGIMRDHEGAVRVRSRPEAGTEFELYFPEDREPAARIVENQSDVRPGLGESVLLVDDEIAVAEAVAAILRKLGYRVEKFHEPLAALERFARAPGSFDLLLTDCTMPGLTGPELAARLRAFRPGLPILLMTGMRSTATAPDSPGYFEVLDKPAGLSALSLAVRRAIEASSP